MPKDPLTRYAIGVNFIRWGGLFHRSGSALLLLPGEERLGGLLFGLQNGFGSFGVSFRSGREVILDDLLLCAEETGGGGGLEIPGGGHLLVCRDPGISFFRRLECRSSPRPWGGGMSDRSDGADGASRGVFPRN